MESGEAGQHFFSVEIFGGCLNRTRHRLHAEKFKTVFGRHWIVGNESGCDIWVTKILSNPTEFRQSVRNLHIRGIGLGNWEEFRMSRNQPTEFSSTLRNLALPHGIYMDKKCS